MQFWKFGGLLALAALGLGAMPPAKAPARHLSDFALWNVDGKVLSTAEMGAQKGLVVVFMCNHCPMVREYLPKLDTLQALTKREGYALVGINPMDSLLYEEETRTGMQAFAKGHHISYPYLQDADQQVAHKLAVAYTPEVYVLSKTRNGYTLAYHGAIDNGEQPVRKSWVMQTIRQLNARKPVAVAHRTSVGCVVKYRR